MLHGYYDDLRFLALRWLLERMPKNDSSIVGAEGNALYYEILGDYKAALTFRIRELKLMERLHRDVKVHAYPASTRRALLTRMNRRVLASRRRIIKSLRRKIEKERK
jgi:hypothetical protein